VAVSSALERVERWTRPTDSDAHTARWWRWYAVAAVAFAGWTAYGVATAGHWPTTGGILGALTGISFRGWRRSR
jgi:hypothetical protein